MAEITNDLMHRMATTAFDVLNWARRQGLKRDQQIEQVVKGFKVDLKEASDPGQPVPPHGSGP